MVSRRPQIAKGHEEPFAVHFSVFLANRVGQFKDLLDILAAEDLEVLGVSVIDSTDWAVLRIVVSDPNKAGAVLQAHGLPYTESRVLLPVLRDDKPLSQICGLLLQAEINVHFAYPLTLRHDDCAVMVFHVDDAPVAAEILSRHGVVLLGDEDLRDRA